MRMRGAIRPFPHTYSWHVSWLITGETLLYFTLPS